MGAILKRYELSFEGVGSTDVQGEVKLGKVRNPNPGDLLYIGDYLEDQIYSKSTIYIYGTKEQKSQEQPGQVWFSLINPGDLLYIRDEILPSYIRSVLYKPIRIQWNVSQGF